jgi:hypothetical protein
MPLGFEAQRAGYTTALSVTYPLHSAAANPDSDGSLPLSRFTLGGL